MNFKRKKHIVLPQSELGLKAILTFPCRYFRFRPQCRGTGTVPGAPLSSIRKDGSAAVTSCASTRSGCFTCCFNSATVGLIAVFNFRLLITSPSSPNPSPVSSSIFTGTTTGSVVVDSSIRARKRFKASVSTAIGSATYSISISLVALFSFSPFLSSSPLLRLVFVCFSFRWASRSRFFRSRLRRLRSAVVKAMERGSFE